VLLGGGEYTTHEKVARRLETEAGTERYFKFKISDFRISEISRFRTIRGIPPLDEEGAGVVDF
jgi:hypothetical protein